MPEYTTLAVGEEEPDPTPITTLALGEETPDPTPITTLALGEETPPTDVPHWAEDGPSTRMYGEEGEFVTDPPCVSGPFGGF